MSTTIVSSTTDTPHIARRPYSYWNDCGRYQKLADALQELVPPEGPVASPNRNKALERYRKAVNAYYDLYNNGGCNRPQAINAYFKGALRLARSWSWGQVPYATEAPMDRIILAAALEQGLIDNINNAQEG